MRVAVLVLALAACTERYGGPLTVPTVGTQTPAHEPLDLTWQVGLYIFPRHTLLGGGGPEGVYGAHARAIEPARCSPRVVEDPDDIPPALVVVGLAEGPCDVELTYRHPQHGDTRTVMLHVVFDPPEALPVLAVGSAMPAAPFVLELPAGPARCDRPERPGERGDFHCYAAELPFGAPRFAKGSYDEWFRSRSPSSFALCVRRDRAGRVVGLRGTFDPRYGEATPADLVRGEPNPECSQ